MMTSHKDFPADNLVRRSVVDDGVSGKLLTTRRTFEIALSVIRHYHIGIALNKRSRAVLFVAVKQSRTFSTMHCDCVCFPHITS